MYIHLGNNFIISAGDIIAILNLEPPVAIGRLLLKVIY